MKRHLWLILLFSFFSCEKPVKQAVEASDIKLNYQHSIPFAPKTYVCFYNNLAIEIDGRLDDPAWENVPWTEDFVDIEGDLKPAPRHRTRAKMLWGEEYFYFAAQLEEPHIWATITKRDAVMYHDDDFEIFIDPDGDGHFYYEFEMNANNAIWDLLLLRPYRVDSLPKYLNNWDINGIKTAVHIDGTLNDSSDEDAFWSVEIAMPWSALMELAPESRKPKDQEQWRVNFSRVDWPMDIIDRGYKKQLDPATGQNKRENNWVWSPSGRVDMHQTETWGYVQFSKESPGQKEVTFIAQQDEKIKWALWQLYFQQQDHLEQTGKYTDDLNRFTIPEVVIKGYDFKPEVQITSSLFEISAEAPSGGWWHIRSDGRIWRG